MVTTSKATGLEKTLFMEPVGLNFDMRDGFSYL